jgi:L-iditol 2-dehydrogenase
MKDNMMKAIVWMGGNQMEVQEVSIPALKADEVLIDVAYAGICGSDPHIMGGALAGIVDPPRILGHEFSGVVAQIGSEVKNVKVGDRVVAHPNNPCGRCYFCRKAMENFCTNLQSVHRGPHQGAFAEYVAVNMKQVYQLPENISLREAALVEPAAIAIHGIDRTQIKPGESVLITGGGIIGLLTLEVAKLAGAYPVILSEPEVMRREIGLSVGADIVIDPIRENLSERILQITQNRGVDACIDASGALKVIEQCIHLTRSGGRMVIISWPPKGATIPVSPCEIYQRELDIRGVFFSPFSFERTIAALPRLNLKPLITHEFSLNDYAQAFEAQKDRAGIKVLFKP